MVYNVYVIELDKEVLSSKKFREKNPCMNTGKACFYVGQTTHDPVRLVPEIFTKFNPIAKRKEAEYIEQWITEKLREKGHGVWSN